MDYIGNLFTESIQDMLSVFSDPMVLLPVCSCVLFVFIFNLVHMFTTR